MLAGWSAPLEGGGTLLDGGAQALAVILGRGAALAATALVAQGVLEAEAAILAQVLLSEADRDGRAGGEAAGEVERRLLELVGLDQGVEEAEAIGLAGINDPAGVDQLGRLGRADQLRQQEGATRIGAEADVDVDLAEAGGRGGDAQVGDE